MADGVTLDPGTGGDLIAADDLGAAGKVQWVKLRDGTDGGSQTIASGGGVEAAALRVTVALDSTGVISVDDNGGSLTVDGTVTVQDGGSSISVDDNGGSLTVDGTVELGATSLAALESITVVDGGGSLTVDGTVDTELTTADLDTGAGTDTRAVVGLALAASGGAVLAGAANPVPIADNGGSITVDGTVTANAGTGPFPVSDNGGSITVDNGGTFAVQDSEKLADDAAFTVGTTKVNPVGFLADQTSTDSVNEGDIGAARITLDRKQIVTVAPSADTEGLLISRDLDLDETELEIKATAGKLYGWAIYNDGAAEVYVKLYNATAATVVVGTTTPVLTFPIPAGGAANVEFANGITFSTAICAAATTGVADADTAAPALNQVIANFFYQ